MIEDDGCRKRWWRVGEERRELGRKGREGRRDQDGVKGEEGDRGQLFTLCIIQFPNLEGMLLLREEEETVEKCSPPFSLSLNGCRIKWIHPCPSNRMNLLGSKEAILI